MGKIKWYCDFCGKELSGKFYHIEDRKIDKNGDLIEYDNVFFVCKNCMNEGGW